MSTAMFARLTAAVMLALGSQGTALAQTGTLAPGQVSGAEVQSWLDTDGFVIAGINAVNGCYFMIRSNREGRRQTLDCPNQAAPFSVTGEGKVVGNQFCSKFSYPDGSKVDVCYDIFKTGENKYETRAGTARTVFYRLTR